MLLLENDEQYSGRVTIEENETDASVNILGNSLAPFSGTLWFLLHEDEIPLTSLEKRTHVLLKSDEETVAISWNKTFDPGIVSSKSPAPGL